MTGRGLLLADYRLFDREVNQVMAIRKRLSGQRGFTLIELLVVVAILGILATVAVPRVMDAIDNARAKKALADMTVIRDGLERFYVDYGVFPPSLDYLKGKPVQTVVPVPPLAGPITAYIDPNFTFMNSYGNLYIYIVRWETLTDSNSLKDYLVGDPGRTPTAIGAWTEDNPGGSTSLPVGLYDTLGTGVAPDAYFWGSAATAVFETPGGGFIVTKNTDGSKYELLFTLTAFEGLSPPAHVLKPTPQAATFTYTGQ